MKIFNNKQKELNPKIYRNAELGIEVYLTLAILLSLCCTLIPDIALATNLETSADKISSLTIKGKTIGISAATIMGSIWSIFKGNIKLTASIVAIGIILGLYLQWIDGGMKI